jgi:hypothetical protein
VIAAWLYLAVPSQLLAGAWVTPPQHAYLRVGGQVLNTDSRYDFEGNEVPLANLLEYQERAIAGYYAMGVIDHVEASVSLLGKHLRLNTTSVDTTSTGLGDLYVGLKVGDIWRGVALAAQLDAKFPTGYDDELDPPLGDGQVDLGGRLMLGASLWPLVPGYFGLEGGYMHRAGNPNDLWTALVEAGTNVFHDVGVRAKWSGSYSREIPASNEEATDLFALDKRVSQIEGTLWFEIVHDGFLELGVSHILSAKNYTAGDAIMLGFARKFDFTAPPRSGP